MFVARRAFRARYGDEIVEVAEGEHLADGHPLVRQHPDEFEHIPEAVDPTLNGHAGGRSGAAPRPVRLALDAELRIRRERLAELDRRAADRPAPSTGEQRFWEGVDELLHRDQRRREERERDEWPMSPDELDELRARQIADEREDLSAWLDRP